MVVAGALAVRALDDAGPSGPTGFEEAFCGAGCH